MQFLAFHNLVKQFINRKDVTDDQIDFFINTALREFQLRQNLNFTRKSATATYPSTSGLGIVLDGVGGVDPYFRALLGDYAVSFLGENGAVTPLLGDTFTNVQRRLLSSRVPDSVVYYTRINDGQNILFLYPEVADARLVISFFSWIEEYSWSAGPTREDWMLKYGNQVLLWGALKVANRFFGEDGKIAVGNAQYNAAIDSILRMDAQLPFEGASLNLD